MDSLVDIADVNNQAAAPHITSITALRQVGSKQWGGLETKLT
jgi:hypothetical protein